MLTKLIQAVKAEYELQDMNIGYEVACCDRKRPRFPRVAAGMATAWALVRRWPLALVCKVRGCDITVEEHGDAESGPSYDWHCKRCGCGGHGHF